MSFIARNKNINERFHVVTLRQRPFESCDMSSLTVSRVLELRGAKVARIMQEGVVSAHLLGEDGLIIQTASSIYLHNHNGEKEV